MIAEIYDFDLWSESATATLEINIKYIMLSLWAIRLSTAATLNPRRNTRTHSGNPFLIFGQYTWPKWHLEFYYYAETSAITTITTTN